MQFHVSRLNRPVKRLREHDSHHDQGAWDRYVAQQKAELAEFLTEWTPPPPPEDDEDGFKASAIESGAFEAWKLRRTGRVTAATAPFWTNSIEDSWLTTFVTGKPGLGLLDREPTAASVTLPFVMQGGELPFTHEAKNVTMGRRCCDPASAWRSGARWAFSAVS